MLLLTNYYYSFILRDALPILTSSSTGLSNILYTCTRATVQQEAKEKDKWEEVRVRKVCIVRGMVFSNKTVGRQGEKRESAGREKAKLKCLVLLYCLSQFALSTFAWHTLSPRLSDF